jgi:GGDEF domain-containing protein
MREADLYASFTLRLRADGERVAVFHRIAVDGAGEEAESVFDAASLQVRIANLRRAGLDAAVSEAALAALRHAAAPAPVLSPDLPMGPAADQFVAGLPGREALLRALEAAIASAQGRLVHGPCLALLQVQGGAARLDGGGTPVAQAVLLGLADRLMENLRRVDTLAHLGGCRFAACLPRVPRSEAVAITERLCRVVAEAPFETPGGAIALTLDSALFQAPTDEEASAAARASALLATADRSLVPGLPASAGGVTA